MEGRAREETDAAVMEDDDNGVAEKEEEAPERLTIAAGIGVPPAPAPAPAPALVPSRAVVAAAASVTDRDDRVVEEGEGNEEEVVAFANVIAGLSLSAPVVMASVVGELVVGEAMEWTTEKSGSAAAAAAAAAVSACRNSSTSRGLGTYINECNRKGIPRHSISAEVWCSARRK